MQQSFKKTVMVTGVSGNLGKAVAASFLAAGYYVTGTILPGENFSHSFNNDQFSTVEIDLTDEEKCQQIINELISRKGKIDAAVLTAGGFVMGDITGATAADVRKQYSLNFETAYNIARPVFMHMKQQSFGRLFFIGSRPGLDPHFAGNMVAYSLSKSLLFRLAQLINDEARGTNVTASVVVPSIIDTAANRQSMPDADFSKWVSPEQIAANILWHCSDQASILREPIIKVYGNS